MSQVVDFFNGLFTTAPPRYVNTYYTGSGVDDETWWWIGIIGGASVGGILFLVLLGFAIRGCVSLKSCYNTSGHPYILCQIIKWTNRLCVPQYSYELGQILTAIL